ncbi:hypothetical protein JBF11_00625 [Taurinivorans muris]|uniref:Heme exporter protein D n=2 Tax=Taurinivorans muris TaxID=2787751 RepID=A0ABY5Y3B7_9BACT|nr:hypothetical protein [Mailhella sp.]UWX06694.1 hypothetical protein JBF11_00625 [Desulfovibrionaceae bacterium LT0009]HBV41569.1 hypothetical protein [Desulfovibrio sp.]
MQMGETIHSPAPWDLPLWDPSHVVFFGVLYAVLIALGVGLALVHRGAVRDMKNEEQGCKH